MTKLFPSEFVHCRGSIALGTGCGKCARCLQERNEIELARERQLEADSENMTG